MSRNLPKPLARLLLVLVLIVGPGWAQAQDWPDWRGPARDGVSTATNLPTEWAPGGAGMAWKAPYGGRSAPVVLGNHLYLQNAAGEGASEQERVMAFDADTGDLLWEYRFNVYHSDVPPHRVGWSSPVADPATGHVFALGVGGRLVSLTSDGELRWERFLVEDFGLITTHGGRTVSPIIEGDLVIVGGASSGWGDQAIGRHRFFGFDKRTGETIWVSTPSGPNYDTTYSTPIATEVNGMRVMIVGAGDGAVHALQPQTGASVWRLPLSKRGINTGIVMAGTTAIVTHGEENLDTSEMGLVAAVDASATGETSIESARWRITGFQAGYSSPVVHDGLLYQIDNSSNLAAIDATDGTVLWELNLGTIQRASPVFGDGKLYVGSQTGLFYILQPGREGCEVLSEVQLGTPEDPELIIASAAIARGRVYVVTERATYAIGPTTPSSPVSTRAPAAAPTASGGVALVQVVPTEVVMEPGQSRRFRARAYDARGVLIGERDASWALDGLEGVVSETGELTPSPAGGAQAGALVATVEGVTGAARIRVIPALPSAYDFEGDAPGTSPAHWIGARGKFSVREVEGQNVLVKLDDNPFTRRTRVFVGDSSLADYTIEADVWANERRRQMGDAGVIAQRHVLVLMGNHQRLELQTWQPETTRTISVPLAWNPDTWYRMKLRVENLLDGNVRARGKVWPAADPEPDAWTVEQVDVHPHPQGSPGLYANAPVELFFDNIRVSRN